MCSKFDLMSSCSGPVSEIHFPSGLRSPSSGPSSSLFDISLCLSCAVSLLRSVWGVASFVQVLCVSVRGLVLVGCFRGWVWCVSPNGAIGL